MIRIIFGGYVVGLVVAALSDPVVGAVIGGAFTMLNTVLLVRLNRSTGAIQADQKATKEALTAPRRIIYDQGGNPIGTVLDLNRGGEWDTWLSQHSRRADDPPGT